MFKKKFQKLKSQKIATDGGKLAGSSERGLLDDAVPLIEKSRELNGIPQDVAPHFEDKSMQLINMSQMSGDVDTDKAQRRETRKPVERLSPDKKEYNRFKYYAALRTQRTNLKDSRIRASATKSFLAIPAHIADGVNQD